MAKYLDWGGLLTFWSKIKSYISTYANITTNNSLVKINVGSNNVTPVTGVTAGDGLNTTSNDTATDGGTIGGTNNSGTIYLSKSGVTAGSYGPSANATPSATETFNVPYVTVDKYGRVTAASTKTVTIPEAPSSFNITVTDNILDGTGGANSVKYAPYSSKAAGKLYTGTTAPNSTNRLNYDGYLWATKLYSRGSEVLTSVEVDGLIGSSVSRYAVCSTAADVAVKEVSIDDLMTPIPTGARITVNFTNANTATYNPQLSVNLSPSDIYYQGALITASDYTANFLKGIRDFVYDGVHWNLVGSHLDRVDSVDNHYTPSADGSAQLTASISGTAGTYAVNTEYTVLTGVKAQRDSKGHVTGLTYTALKVKDTDTKNTAGSTDTSDKIYIVGAKSLAANPLTYSQDTAYVGTDGHLYSNSILVVNLSGSLDLTNKTYNGVGISIGSLGIQLYKDSSNYLYIPYNSTYTLGPACQKGVITNINSDSDSLPTVTAVKNYVSNLMSSVAGALVYKGVITSESTLLNTALTKGWYYIVNMPNAQTTSITIGGVECEAGDMIIVKTAGTYTTSSSLGTAIDIIQSNIAVITDSEINSLT